MTDAPGPGRGRTAPFPDLFLVGAPKCGTTTFQAALEAHPDVFFAREKDTSFFCTDLVDASLRPDEAGYRALFAGWNGEPAVGESSVFYLYSPAAREAIRERAPDARIFVLVRDPVEMVPSYHAQMVLVGAEPIEDLAEAMAAEDARRRGERLPPGFALDPSLLLYSEIGHFSGHVRRWRATLGRDRVAVIVFDDLLSRSGAVLEEAFRHVGVEPARSPHLAEGRPLPWRNPAREVRSRRLRGLVARPPGWVRRLARLLLPGPGTRRRVADRILAWNRRPTGGASVAPEVRARLREIYAPEVGRLEELLERDLGAWRGP